MLTFFKHILLFVSILSAFNVDQQEVAEHKVVVNHPAFEVGSSTDFMLKEILKKNKVSEFYIEVESVICIDHLCKIVPVRLYWNTFGDYLRYELDKGIRLEKGEGEPFIDEDYQLLQKILLDKNSPYRDISYYDITHEKVIGEGQVDAVSGATETVLKKGETVIGAAWTCFTLWHWANGDIVQEIRRITGGRLDSKQLLAYLKSDTEAYQVFVLNELIKRKTYDASILDFLNILVPQASKEINKYVIQYIEQAPLEVYEEMILSFYALADKDIRLLYLNSLSRSKIVGNQKIYDVFTKNISDLESFQEIDLLLNIMSGMTLTLHQLEQISGLLDQKNFLIARRAYWFLVQQEPSADTKTKIQKFYERHKEKLK